MNFTPSSCFKNSFLAPVITALALALLLMAGCADENPDLVNPRGGNDSITVRFVNFASDGLPRTFAPEGGESVSVRYGEASALQRSMADSVLVSVLSGGSLGFKTPSRIIFGKNTVQTIVALPSRDSAIGRLVNLSASYVQPSNTTSAFVRFFNAMYDTTEIYSLRLGCPNGEPFGSPAPFAGFGAFAEVPPGEVVISVLSQKQNQSGDNEKIIGTFRFNITTLRSYTIFAFKKDNRPEFMLLDELNGAVAALQPIERVTENTVEIRTINFSQSGVDIFNQSKKTIASGIAPNSIGSYEAIVTCDGTGADSLSVFAEDAGSSASSITTSLDVLKRYSVIVLDSGSGRANYSILVPPSRNSFKTPGMASVRVVNATSLFKNITVSLGAQSDSGASGFRSGGTLATALLKGRTSEIVEIQPGNAPLAIFTSAQPAQLLMAAPVGIQPGEEYLLIVQNADDGSVRASLLKAGTQAQMIEFLQKGSFIQVVHAVPGLEKLSVSLSNSVSSARLFYGNSLATVISEGALEVWTGNAFKTIMARADSSTLVVIAGTAAAPEILVFSKASRPVAAGTLERRVIHASKELGPLSVFANDTVSWAERLAENISYGQASDFQRVDTERRLSLIFWNPLLKEVYLRTENINFPLGRRYSLILAGSKENGGSYTVITQQEF